MDDPFEDRARSLLTLAADTIPVAAGPSSVVRRPPVWPWLVAAAAVVLAAVVVPAALMGGGQEVAPQPDPVPSTVLVPQTLWMTEDQAREALREAGLDVEVRTQAQCELTGRVLGTRPRPGSAVALGRRITLTVAGLPVSGPSCPFRSADAVALGLLDLARFGTEDLRFAPEVEVYVDGRVTRRLDSTEAGVPQAWGAESPLSRLLDALDLAQGMNPAATPILDVRQDRNGRSNCVWDYDDPLAGELATVVRFEPLVDGQFLGCRDIRVYRDPSGRIAAVVSDERVSTVELFRG